MLKIRPGILVSLKTEVHDKGLSYESKLLESDATTQTTLVKRTMLDAAEHVRAVKSRGAVRSAIEAVCASTPFGLLCPQADRDRLDGAIAQARALVERHRTGYVEGDGTVIPPARYTSISLYVIKGEIASTDKESADAIANELRSLLATVNDGIDRLDVEAIREAATKAKEMSVMLDPDVEAQVSAAVKAARVAARQIVARVEKKGEEAATVLSEIDRSAIASARMAFIDTDEATVEGDDAMPSVAAQRFADLSEESEPTATDLADDAIERDASNAGRFEAMAESLDAL